MKRILAIFLFYIFSFNSVFANLYFSEIMPNTTDDTNLEYIEITNSGEEKIDLQGYKIKDKSGKEFDFGYGDFINSNDSKKYYRPTTKILLNNTNEELYLYDSSGSLLDSFSYSTSTKGQAIIRNNTDENQSDSGSIDNQTNSGTIDDENLSDTGSIQDSSSGSIEESTDNTNGTDSGTPNTEQEEKIKINFSFQNPSYVLDNTSGKQEYICDEDKDECKINLDLRNSFSGNFKESDFNCEIDFGLDGWTNGQEHKCNPNTVIFPKGTFEIKIKISSKTDPNNFDIKTFILKNNPKTEIVYKDKIVYEEKITYESSSCTSSNNVDKEVDNNTSLSTNSNISKINITNPIIEIQSGIKDGKCTKTDCSVNLIYKPKNKQERCLWNFGNGTFKTKDTDKKCNPGYVKFPIGNHKISLKVYQKDLESNYKLSHLNFSNFPKDTKNNKQDNDKIVENNKKENIKEFKVDKIDNKKENNSEEIIDININFTEFEVQKEIIDNVDKKENKSQEYPQTKSKVVYFTDNDISKNVILRNKYSQEVKISPIKADIKVQGRIGKNKKLEDNILTCFDTCSVNFDLETDSQNIEKYFWDFGNGKTFDGKNPSYIKFEKFGKYKILLTMQTDFGEKLERQFFVNFYPKPKLAKTYKTKKTKKITSSKKISSKKKISSYLIASPDTCKQYFPKIPKDLTRLQNFMYFLLFIIFMLMGVIIMQKRNLI